MVAFRFVPTYSLQSGDAGVERLRLLAAVHEQSTRELFERLDIADRPQCLDVGCGIGEVSRLLAQTFAARGGSVLGVDIDSHYVEFARASTTDLPVKYAQAGVHELAEQGQCDLVYARFLLSHLRNPQEALAKMIAAGRSGATLAIEDVDFSGAFCHPSSADFDRYLGWYDQMTRGNGGDPNFGRALLGHFADAGIAVRGLAVHQPTFYQGPGKHLACLTLEHIAHTLEERGIASRRDLDETIESLRSYTVAPHTLLSMPRIFQVWGTIA